MMMTVIVGNYPTLITSRAKSSAFTPPFADTCQTDRPADRVNTRPINSIRNVTAYPVQIFYPLASSELLLISHHVLRPLYIHIYVYIYVCTYTLHSPIFLPFSFLFASCPSLSLSPFSLAHGSEFRQTRTINRFSIECIYIHTHRKSMVKGSVLIL